jgi:hypothetical protein
MEYKKPEIVVLGSASVVILGKDERHGDGSATLPTDASCDLDEE